MSSIDQRIVQMRFDNAQFESGTKQTISTLDRLKAALRLDGATTGLSNISKASEQVDMSAIQLGAQAIQDRFSVMGIASMEVIRRLTSAAIDMGGKLKNFFLSPIIDGGLTRALNLEQARFQFKGLGMDVEATMENALTAVKGTSFGLDEAARVAGQFGATGMTAGDEMASALRAVSGVAAMTGRSYSDVGHIFTTVSGNGRLMGMQLTQLGSYGLNAAAEIAKSMGITEAAVRDMASKGQISFEDFYKAMDGAFGEHATKANETYSGSLANVRAALSRLGASFQAVRIEKMIPIFQALAPMVDTLTEAVAPLVVKFEEYATLISGKVVAAIKSIDFTKLTGDLKDQPKIIKTLVSVFKSLWEVVLLGVDVVKSLAGIFSTLWLASAPVRDILMDLAIVVANLIGSFAAILRNSKVGEWFENVANAATDMSNKIEKAFSDAKSSLEGSSFVNLLNKMADGLKNLASKFAEGVRFLVESLAGGLGKIDFDVLFGVAGVSLIASVAKGIKDFVQNMKSPLEGLQGILDSVIGILDGVRGALEQWQNSLKAKTLITIASAIGILAASLFLLSTIDGAALARSLMAITVMMVQLLAALSIFTDIAPLEKGMTKSIFALVGISVAILILAGAMKSLSGLDWDQIAKGLLSVAILMGALVVTARSLSANQGAMIKGATGMILFAVAIRVLSGAVEKLSTLKWDELTRGLFGVVTIMASLAIFVNAIDKQGLFTTGIGILLVATGIRIMASAISLLSTMSWEEQARGLFGMATGLTILGFAVSAMPNNMALIGAGLMIVSASLIVLGLALKIMASMSWEEQARGLFALAGSLIILAIGLQAMQGTLVGSAALLVAAIAIGVLAPAMLVLSSIPWQGAITGLLTLAGVFVVFGVAAALLTPLIVPMLGLAAALLLLGVAVMSIGAGMMMAGIGIASLATGFAALAGMTTSGAKAVVESLTTIITGIVTLIPTVAAALAQGIIEFAGVIAAGAPTLAQAFIAIVSSIMEVIGTLIPQAVTLFGQLILALVEAIVTNIPIIAEGFLQLILGLLEVIATNIPLLVQAGVDIIIAFIDGIAKAVPQLVDAGFKAIIAFIDGLAAAIQNNTPTLIASMQNLFRVIGEAGKQVLSSFIPSFSSVGSSIMNSGVVQGIRGGIGSLISTVSGAISSAVSSARSGVSGFFSAGASMMSGMVSGIVSGIGNLISAAASAASQALQAAKNAISSKSPSKKFKELGMDADRGFAIGFTEGAGIVSDAARAMSIGALDAVSKTIGELGNKVLGEIDAQPVIRPIMDLTEIQNGVKDINSLTSSKTTKLAGSVKGVSSTTSVLEMIDDVVSSTVGSIFKAIDTSTTKQTDTVIEVPVYLDGREIARATAPYSRQEINKLDKLQVRLGGGTA